MNQIISPVEAARAFMPYFREAASLYVKQLQEVADKTGRTQRGHIGMAAFIVKPADTNDER